MICKLELYCYGLEYKAPARGCRETATTLWCVPSDNDFINQMIEIYSRELFRIMLG